MVNIKFPDTNIVSCVFSLKNGTNCRYDGPQMNEFGFVEDGIHKLKQYSYRVPEYLQGKLAVGDFVVVYCQTGYQVCQVSKVNVTVLTSFDKLAPVVAKFDMDQYINDLLKQKELESMKQVLIKERKRLEEQVTWDLIAEKSPELAAMLKAFRDAGGEF